jgi:hypothetical protein
MCALFVCAGLVGCSSPPRRQVGAPTPTSRDTVDGFVPRVFTSGDGRLPYRLFVPPGYTPNNRYPLIVWLPGASGIGTNNVNQIIGDQRPGTHAWTTPASQMRYPAFVLVPQSMGPSPDGR